ncbi:hypothetical protein D8S78_11860 [Natrialba swarupiae]|nr:hypothetical protein [Natrialba swarupiae]
MIAQPKTILRTASRSTGRSVRVSLVDTPSTTGGHESGALVAPLGATLSVGRRIADPPCCQTSSNFEDEANSRFLSRWNTRSRSAEIPEAIRERLDTVSLAADSALRQTSTDGRNETTAIGSTHQFRFGTPLSSTSGV